MRIFYVSQHLFLTILQVDLQTVFSIFPIFKHFGRKFL